MILQKFSESSYEENAVKKEPEWPKKLRKLHKNDAKKPQKLAMTRKWLEISEYSLTSKKNEK